MAKLVIILIGYSSDGEIALSINGHIYTYGIADTAMLHGWIRVFQGKSIRRKAKALSEVKRLCIWHRDECTGITVNK